MRITSSIRLLAMAVLLAAPVAASASPPPATDAVEPLTVKTVALDSMVTPQFVLTDSYNATAMALDSFVRAATLADSAFGGVQTSGALRSAAERVDVSQRMRPSLSDSVAAVTSRIHAAVLTTRIEPPNRGTAERTKTSDLHRLRQRL